MAEGKGFPVVNSNGSALCTGSSKMKKSVMEKSAVEKPLVRKLLGIAQLFSIFTIALILMGRDRKSVV